eukprot:TRINITY_DN2424_c0_g1_i2.p1 TRINITY_DN2424_c0_g1~~TRINITY_DN2424_c0_g1_i2.p1  ORF type:complete len:122 (+),score=18.28 TRINITY_DN2424_c0_g1_i2:43-408(+)
MAEENRAWSHRGVDVQWEELENREPSYGEGRRASDFYTSPFVTLHSLNQIFKYWGFTFGALACTVGALGGGFYAIHTRNSALSNRMMRLRIAMQGLTVACLMYETIKFNVNPPKKPQPKTL